MRSRLGIRHRPPTDATGKARSRTPLLSTPFFAFGPRPFREAHLVGYVVCQHRRGRTLAEILDDPLVADYCGCDRRRILTNPRLIRALTQDVVDAVEAARSVVTDGRSARSDADAAGAPDGVSIVGMLEALRES